MEVDQEPDREERAAGHDRNGRDREQDSPALIHGAHSPA